MNDLGIISVLWTGDWPGKDHRPYDPSWVVRLWRMVKEHTSFDFDFYCLTNWPDRLDFPRQIKTIPLKYKWQAWWSKIEVFRHGLVLNPRLLYLDLDVLVVGDLDPMIDIDSSFALFDVWSFSGFTSRAEARRRMKLKRGCRAVPIYSSCAISMRNGSRPELYDDFHTNVMDDLCGDQDWIGECLGPHETTFPISWGRNLIDRDRDEVPDLSDGLKIIACRNIKNHMLADNGFKWAHNLWNGGQDV